MSYLQTAKSICEKYTKEISYQHSNPRKGKGSRKRIVCISDLHAPFTRMDLVDEIITRHSGADTLVINGDLFDAHIISSFQKRKEVPFIDEYRIAGNIIMALSKEFGQVILIDGNHEKRLSHLVAKLDPSVQFLFKSSPLAYIAEGKRFSETGKELDNVVMENVVYAGNINKASHWLKIGGAVFVHRLRGYGKAPMANAVHEANWFADRFNFDVLIASHTHHVGLLPYKSRALIEQGCLCLPLEYEEDGSFNRRPQELGYALVELDKEGNVDTRYTFPIYLGTYSEEQ